MIRRVAIIALLAIASAAYGQGWDVLGALWTEPMASAVSPLGGAVDLDGSSEHFKDGTSGLLNGATSFTVCAWVKNTGFKASAGILANTESIASKVNGLTTRSTGKTYVFYYADAGGQAAVVTPDNSLNTGVWAFVVGSVSSGVVGTIYLNGVGYTTLGVSKGVTADSTKFMIGYDEYTSLGDRHLPAIVDDCAIWKNRALTSNEVATLYNNGKGAPITAISTNGLVRYWKLDDGLSNSSATQALDSVSGTYAPGTGIGSDDWTNGIVPQ